MLVTKDTVFVVSVGDARKFTWDTRNPGLVRVKWWVSGELELPGSPADARKFIEAYSEILRLQEALSAGQL